MMWTRYEVHRITEMKDGAVFKTEKIEDRWLNPFESIALRPGSDDKGLILTATNDVEFQKERPASK